MTDTTETADDPIGWARPQVPAQETGPGTELAIPDRDQILAVLGTRQVDYTAWAKALITGDPLEEDATDDAGLSIVRAILLAETSGQALAAVNMVTTDELIGTEPGARSNVLEIYSARPLASTYEDGAGSFCVIDARDLAEGRDLTFSCGALAVQTVLLACQMNGWMPLKCRLTRRAKPTRRGYYPLNLEGGI